MAHDNPDDPQSTDVSSDGGIVLPSETIYHILCFLDPLDLIRLQSVRPISISLLLRPRSARLTRSPTHATGRYRNASRHSSTSPRSGGPSTPPHATPSCSRPARSHGNLRASSSAHSSSLRNLHRRGRPRRSHCSSNVHTLLRSSDSGSRRQTMWTGAGIRTGVGGYVDGGSS